MGRNRRIMVGDSLPYSFDPVIAAVRWDLPRQFKKLQIRSYCLIEIEFWGIIQGEKGFNLSLPGNIMTPGERKKADFKRGPSKKISR